MSRKLERWVVCVVVWFLAASAGWCFYNPSQGRWVSRDPIGEKGGRNIRAFLANNPISRRDSLGLCCEGHVRDPMAIGTVTPGGVSPGQLAAIRAFVDAVGGWNNFDQIMSIATVSAGAGVSLAQAIESAAEEVLGNSVPDGIESLVQAYQDAMILGLQMVGYGVQVQIQYKVCRSILGFTWWSDTQDPWQQVNGPPPSNPLNATPAELAGLFDTSIAAWTYVSTAKASTLAAWRMSHAQILDN